MCYKIMQSHLNTYNNTTAHTVVNVSTRAVTRAHAPRARTYTLAHTRVTAPTLTPCNNYEDDG